MKDGDKGNSYEMKNERIMVKKNQGGLKGKDQDIERKEKDIIKMKRRMNEI